MLGRLPWSSNATFLVDLLRPDGSPGLQGVYKPEQGERPLWDFPPGLYRREVAAYLLSKRLEWDLVPPTVQREGPFGPGSLQLFVPADFEQHYFLLRERPEFHPGLRRLAAFDVVANAADRKGGHVLLEGDSKLWAVDNGLCFHSEFKLRTVLWDFAGEPLPDDVASGLKRLCGGGVFSNGESEMEKLLSTDELRAITDRAAALLDQGRFPDLRSERDVPWPPL